MRQQSMRPSRMLVVAICGIGAAAVWTLEAAMASSVPPTSWSPRAAAAYLDQRQSWWESWPKAGRDHGTVCVSCHTTLPYALARQELGAVLQEEDAPAPERRVIADVT